MSIFSRIKASWQAKSTAEKIKYVLGVMAELGCGMIASDIASRSSIGRSKLERVCAIVGGAGLGMAAGEVSKKAIYETVDAFSGLADEVKKAKAQKEGTANE